MSPAIDRLQLDVPFSFDGIAIASVWQGRNARGSVGGKPDAGSCSELITSGLRASSLANRACGSMVLQCPLSRQLSIDRNV
jgi:hypothetical protein